MTVVTKTATVGNYGVCSATGTLPFAAKQKGGPSGAWGLYDANNLNANLTIHGEKATSVFADQAKADIVAIATALNAA